VTGAIFDLQQYVRCRLAGVSADGPGLVKELGGGDPLAISLSINVGASIVDVSPLSTIGALCVAAVSDPAVSRKLFYQMFVWGCRCRGRRGAVSAICRDARAPLIGLIRSVRFDPADLVVRAGFNRVSTSRYAA